uniref:Spindle-defective protein 2 n=1 Tax=Zeugodacus cucurbitae TaxID=28588 RepID=A0A0A1WPZ6_ZEUCU
MEKRTIELNNLTDSLGVLNLDGLRAFGETSNSSITNSKPVNERLNKERMRALETLEKANKTMKSDVNKIIQQSFVKKDFKDPEPITTSTNSSSKFNRTEYVPYRRPDSINISELVMDESINLDFKSTLSTTNNTKVSFEPSEITGRSTHYKDRKSQKNPKNSIASTSSRLSVGDILAASFAPKARNLGEILGERASVSSTTLGSLNNSRSLLRTADLSLNSSEATFGKCAGVGGQFSFNVTNGSTVNAEEFEPAENMQSKLLMDEIAWAQEFATIPTSEVNKNGKEKMVDAKDFDLQSNPNSSLFCRDPNFSMGRFFNQRSEDLQNIVKSLSPERMRPPIALVDETQSTLSLSTPSGDTKVTESTNDVDRTPQIDNRTYSKAPKTTHSTIGDFEKITRDEHASKDSGNGTKEDDESYLFSLSHIKKAFIKSTDNDISSTDLIDLLKKPKRPKSPQNREQIELERNCKTSPTRTIEAPVKGAQKKSTRNSTVRSSIEQYTNSLNTLEELLSENKENLDPQKMRGSESQADTISFTESLLDASDLKEMQRSINQPRSPLSPLNIPTVRLSPDQIENEVDLQLKSPKIYLKTPERFNGNSNKLTNDSVSPNSRTTNTKPKKPTVLTQNGKSPSAVSPTLTSKQKPLSSTRLDEQKSECDFVAISPNLSKSMTSSKGISAERTLMANGSPYNGLNSVPPSPPRSYMSSQPSSPAAGNRGGCENCSPQLRVKPPTTTTARIHRTTSSPSVSEASTKSVAPMRTASTQSLRSGSGNGGAVRSVSRCSSSSEFSHRDGNAIPLKVTAVELSWGSTRLRNAAHKTMQIKNTASKKLTLRIDVHGPGYQLINMPGNNSLTLQSQECRTIAVSFCPTVIGAAIGKLSFYAPQNTSVAHNSASTASMSSFLDIPLYGYGGHCSVVAQEVHIAPVGMAFLQMGYLHELSQPIQRTIRVYNKGPLLGFALASIDSVGLRLPRLCTAFEIQPTAMLIPPGSSATLRVVFRPQREDVRKITRQTKSVLTLANLRLISGDEANRQRMRQLVARMSPEERANLSSSKSLEALWEKLPGEKDMEELHMFKESPTLTFDLLTNMRIHEVALTINDDYLDETIKSTSSFYFPDEDETVLFRTVCSPSPSNNADGSAHVLDRVDELTEEEVEQAANSNYSSGRGEACCWSVLPSSLTFHLRGEKHTMCSSIFICNSFKSRQYFEVSTNRKNLLQLKPSEGYVEPDGGHLEVEVKLRVDKLNADNRQEPIYITVSMENEHITVPVKLSRETSPQEHA